MGIGPKKVPAPAVFSEDADGVAPARPYPRLYGEGAAQVREVEDGWAVCVALPPAPPPAPPPAAPAPPDVREVRIPPDWDGVLVVQGGRVGVVQMEEAPEVVRALSRLVGPGACGYLHVIDGALNIGTLEGAGGINVRFAGSNPVVDATPLLKRIEALEAALSALRVDPGPST